MILQPCRATNDNSQISDVALYIQECQHPLTGQRADTCFQWGSVPLRAFHACICFWATVCKTIRPMLSVRCPVLSCLLVCLSVTLVYCDQTVGQIKIKLGMQVGLGPGHIVLDGDPASPPKGAQPPNFRPISVAAKWMHGSRCHLVWR